MRSLHLISIIWLKTGLSAQEWEEKQSIDKIGFDLHLLAGVSF